MSNTSRFVCVHMRQIPVQTNWSRALQLFYRACVYYNHSPNGITPTANKARLVQTRRSPCRSLQKSSTVKRGCLRQDTQFEQREMQMAATIRLRQSIKLATRTYVSLSESGCVQNYPIQCYLGYLPVVACCSCSVKASWHFTAGLLRPGLP